MRILPKMDRQMQKRLEHEMQTTTQGLATGVAMEDQKEQDIETGFVNRLYRGLESAIILDRPPDDCP